MSSSRATSPTARRSIAAMARTPAGGHRPFRRRIARRPLDRRPRRVRPHKRAGDVPAARCRPALLARACRPPSGASSASSTSRPTRSTARWAPTGRFTETSPYDPNSPYSASKAAADHFARAYHRTYGLPVLVTNCSNNYGPYQFPEKLIPLMILNAVEGKPLPVYGDGQNVRDWLYVEDHCRAMRRVLRPEAARRDVQHRRQLRAEEPRRGADASARSSTSCVRDCPTPRATSLITFVRIARATTAATPSTPTRSSEAGLAAGTRFRLRLAADRRNGTWTIPAGSSAVYQRRLSTRTSRPVEEPRTIDSMQRNFLKGNHPRRRLRHPAAIRSPGRSASNCCRSTTSR